ncbi:ATP-dependent zinc metalloprotease FtsH [Alistipes sp. dk3620]|uniref:ATP-dependent zinc metalloprotease FtsH n=1 Tax=unclassified Alistipes TaxID=2608932 RepID=UPI0012948A17|nr:MULTISPECIES: ATP-dependent zinc metalloprotease FtsH [unclassified Alistipes]MQX26834.1 ATP-dependent zinc metalloprotease FtsH [Alistipes sp. dk3620]QGA24225.1 ATP-dependent zinc metalloprotease FtsH [Alistipes sp. dk3624]HIV60839.1 ATP-dependent zinc metalloprotease FtsH [Candidatus Alistipes pullistercoris]
MKPNHNNNMPQLGGKRPKFNIYWVWMILAVVILSWGLLGNEKVTHTTTWDGVKEMIEKGDLQKIVVVNKETAEVYLKPDKVASYSDRKEYKGITEHGPQFSFNIGSLDYFQHNLENAQTEYDQEVPLSFETRRNIWGDAFTLIFPILILVGIWWFLWRGMSRGNNGGGGGIFSVGKAKAQMFDKDANVNITFKDVAGLEEAKVEIMEIVDFLKNPGKYSDLGGKIPKGALLVGPPGTGKTLLAKAVAGEANVPFFSISGSDFVEMFVGVGASRVRDLFRQAKEKAPCIVFIDEIDAIGRARSKNVGYSSNDERENTLNQLLTEMDGFGTNAGVIVLAATNRADILDKALLRAGRFDRQINVELPDLKERREIFDVHLKNLKLDPKLDRDFLARQTPGFSGADIANVCNEAALIAARNNKKQVEKEDFLSAIDRIIGGLERKNKIIIPSEKRTIAYHEAGHATVSWVLEHANPLIKVTIIPRGKALGAAWYLPEERQITTKEQMLDEMAAILGGRASELLNFGKVSTGALNDLERVTKQAYAMVAYYGMSSEVGNLSFYDSTGQNDMALTKPYSERTAQEIDAEVKKLIDGAFQRSLETLEKHRAGLTQLAELLLEREVIFAEDLEKIFGKRKGEIRKELEVKIEEPLNSEPSAE